jgi:hypothetical protein
MSNTPKYIVVKSPYQPKAWAIRNTDTGEIVEAGFFSAARALEYIWREYDPAS